MKRQLLALVPLAALVGVALWFARQVREAPPRAPRPVTHAGQAERTAPPGIRKAVTALAARVAAPEPSPRKGETSVQTNGAAQAAELFLPGEVVIRLDDNAVMNDIEQALTALGATLIGRADALRLYRVKLPEGMTVPDGLKAVAGINGVTESMRNNRTALPKDVGDLPLRDSGEPLVPVGATGRALVKADDPTTAHAYGENVLVALLDTGVDAAHPDLSGRVLNGYNFIEGSMDTHDVQGHGTACAGIISGAKGVAPQSYVLPVRVMDETGHGNEFAVVEGILYALDRGAKVISFSIGTYGDSPMLHDAIAYAEKKGAVVVAASGNDGYDHTFMPAGYPEVLCVGAVDADMVRAPFSNYGEALDLVAPGVAVNSLAPKAGYVRVSGTSAAAPFVAGALAALIAQNIYMTPAELRARLLDTADNLGPAGRDDETGAGMLDLERALRRTTDRVNDIALTTLYVTPSSFKPGDRVTVHYVIQNQGTHDLHGAALTTQIGGDEREESLSTLVPGECRDIERPWTVPQSLPKDDMVIKGWATIREADAKPHNNGRGLVIGPALWK